jgi:hypothetical protein
MRFGLVCIVAIIGIIVSVPDDSAHAQKKNSKRAPRVLEIKQSITIEGKIQKPEAFFFLQRSQLNFEGLDPKKSFLPLIIKSVDKAPF